VWVYQVPIIVNIYPLQLSSIMFSLYFKYKVLIVLDTYNCPYCKNTIETIVHLFVQCPKLDNFRKLIIDFIKADLHVDTLSMDIPNIILYNVEFKYYPYVYTYTHAICSCRHNLQCD
jgi:hypothetical protein